MIWFSYYDSHFCYMAQNSDCMAFLLTPKPLKTHVEWCQILYELGLVLVNLLIESNKTAKGTITHHAS